MILRKLVQGRKRVTLVERSRTQPEAAAAVGAESENVVVLGDEDGFVPRAAEHTSDADRRQKLPVQQTEYRPLVRIKCHGCLIVK